MKLHSLRNNTTGGFTLVEVTVTLVILALLSAIVVPAMTGWLDKGGEKSATTACGTCVFVAQTLINENLDENGVNTAVPGTSDILELAGLTSKGAVSNVTVTAPAKLDTLTYTENGSGIAVTYYGTPQPHYALGTGIADTKTTAAAIAEAFEALKNGELKDANGNIVSVVQGNSTITQYSGRIDSIALEADSSANTPWAKKLYDTFPKSVQMSLDEKTWYIENQPKNGTRLFFTLEKQYNAKGLVVYKYDPVAKRYQAKTGGSIVNGKISAGAGSWGDWYDSIEKATAGSITGSKK